MRSEFRRHARWCPKGRPPEGRRLDVFPDYTAFPVWERAGMSQPGRLGISAELTDGLWAWRAWWERRQQFGGGEPADTREWAAWHERGAILADRLAQETGAVVVYRWPHGPAGADPECLTCRPGGHGR